MIKHIVLWSIKEEFDRESVFQEIKEKFEPLVGRIPGMISLDLNLGFQGYDICLESLHEDRAALDAYQEHPEHLALKTLVASYRNERASCDYEIE